VNGERDRGTICCHSTGSSYINKYLSTAACARGELESRRVDIIAQSGREARNRGRGGGGEGEECGNVDLWSTRFS